MVIKILALVRALFKGEALRDPAAWKNVQLLTDTLVAISLAVLAFFPNISISEAQILTICAGIATLVSAVLTVTTTDKIGIGNEGKAYDYIKKKTEGPDSGSDTADDSGLLLDQDERRNVPLRTDSDPHQRAKDLLGG